MIETNESWEHFVNIIAEKFKVGELIPHQYIKYEFKIETPKFSDYKTEIEYIKAFELLNFEYMSIIDKLRNDLLEFHSLYLKNIRGDGYVLLPPKEQTDYAKEKTNNDIKRALENGVKILSYIKHNHLDEIELRKNADALAKLSFMKNMIKSKLN